MERLFNVLPPNIREITGKTTETFKKHIDKWLISIPDTPTIDDCSNNDLAEGEVIIAISHLWVFHYYLFFLILTSN